MTITTTTIKHSGQKVVTWQSPRGAKIDICRECERRLREQGEWPRDVNGEEYCQVHRGEHRGTCDIAD